jgi:hypothetical protein
LQVSETTAVLSLQQVFVVVHFFGAQQDDTITANV